ARDGGRFPVGSTARVRAVSGHRDLVSTSCPGAMQYRDLDSLARQAWVSGGAKLANLTSVVHRRDPASTTDSSITRINARLVPSHADQTVTVRFERISTGELLGSFERSGATVHQVTWRAAAHQSIPGWDIRI